MICCPKAHESHERPFITGAKRSADSSCTQKPSSLTQKLCAVYASFPHPCSRPNFIPCAIHLIRFGFSQPIILAFVCFKRSFLVRFLLHLSFFRSDRGMPLCALPIFLWVVRWRPVRESATPSSSLRVAGSANWGGLTSLGSQGEV